MAPTTPTAQVVGYAFVHQYYLILQASPELVHRFYKDISVISRPDSNGLMTSATTRQGINEKICSLDYKNYEVDINSIDAQVSHEGGLILLVTGCLTGKDDNLPRKFSQSFFLAPQDEGYFVLNDVFRYVEDGGEPLVTRLVNKEVEDGPVVPLASAPKPIHVLEPPAPNPATSLTKEETVDEKALDPSDKDLEGSYIFI